MWKNIEGTWTLFEGIIHVQDINGEAKNDNSGWSVSLSSDGNTVAIGAPNNYANFIGMYGGHVRVFKKIAMTRQGMGSS